MSKPTRRRKRQKADKPSPWVSTENAPYRQKSDELQRAKVEQFEKQICEERGSPPAPGRPLRNGHWAVGFGLAAPSRERGEVFDPSSPKWPSRLEILERCQLIAINPLGELRDERLPSQAPWMYVLALHILRTEKMPSENDNLFTMVENFKDLGLNTDKARLTVSRMFDVSKDIVASAHRRRRMRKRRAKLD